MVGPVSRMMENRNFTYYIFQFDTGVISIVESTVENKNFAPFKSFHKYATIFFSCFLELFFGISNIVLFFSLVSLRFLWEFISL